MYTYSTLNAETCICKWLKIRMLMYCGRSIFGMSGKCFHGMEKPSNGFSTGFDCPNWGLGHF